MIRFTIDMENDLHKQLGHLAIESGKTKKDIVLESLKAYMKTEAGLYQRSAISQGNLLQDPRADYTTSPQAEPSEEAG